MKLLNEPTLPSGLPVDSSWEVVPFSSGGNLTQKVGTICFPIAGGTFDIETVAARVNTAPTGASVVIDVNKNGTTLFGNAANRPTIPAGSKAATVGALSVTSVTTGDYLSVDIDQIGSISPGVDLVLVIRLQRTA